MFITSWHKDFCKWRASVADCSDHFCPHWSWILKFYSLVLSLLKAVGKHPTLKTFFITRENFISGFQLQKYFICILGQSVTFFLKTERYPRYKRSKNHLKSYLMKLEKWSKCISGLHDKLKVWAVNMSSNYHLCTEWGDRERKLKKTTVLAFPAILSTTT